jgi:hypothetical protein
MFVGTLDGWNLAPCPLKPIPLCALRKKIWQCPSGLLSLLRFVAKRRKGSTMISSLMQNAWIHGVMKGNEDKKRRTNARPG